MNSLRSQLTTLRAWPGKAAPWLFLAILMGLSALLTGVAQQTERASREAARLARVTGQYQTVQSSLLREIEQVAAAQRSPTAASVRAMRHAAIAASDELRRLGTVGDHDDQKYVVTALRLHDHARALLQPGHRAEWGRAAQSLATLDRLTQEATEQRGVAQAVALETLDAEQTIAVSTARGNLAAATLLLVTLFAVYRGLSRKERLARQAEIERLQRASLTDLLTDLGNHRAFQEALRYETARARRTAERFAVAAIDVDGLRFVNEQQGHTAGDAALRRAAERLSAACPEARTFRVGADEFLMILPGSALAEAIAALRFAEEELSASGGPSLSIGVAGTALNGGDLDTVEARAQAALAEAKRQGRGRVVSANDVDAALVDQHLKKHQSLRRLMTEQAFQIFFQPIWDLGSGDVRGLEALLSPDPSLGFAGPEDALSAAARAGCVAELDALSRRAAFAAVTALGWKGSVCINLAPHTLADPEFQAETLVQEAQEYGIAPRRIMWEIHAGRPDQQDRIAATAGLLSQAGFGLSLDGVGADEPTLGLLNRCRFDVLKLDRSVGGAGRSDQAAHALLAGIVVMAEETGAAVIAGGVETAASIDALRSAGVMLAQGYLLGGPTLTLPTEQAASQVRQMLNLVQSPLRRAA